MFDLLGKFKAYRAMLWHCQDRYGFIESDKCDSLLFSGLIGCVKGVEIDIDAAYDGYKDQWHRRPTSNMCYPKHSKSTISRDMLIGLAWYAYFNKRLDISEGIINRALKKGVMGEGDLSRTLMSPSLLSTFAWISYRLGGPNRWWLRWIPLTVDDSAKGFVAHLSCLHIILRSILTKKIDTNHLDWCQKQARRQKNNALFAYAAGQTSKAKFLLQDMVIWPENRLPTSSDRKEPWIFQRDFGPDWLGDSEGSDYKMHSGGDFLFLYALIHGEMK